MLPTIRVPDKQHKANPAEISLERGETMRRRPAGAKVTLPNSQATPMPMARSTESTPSESRSSKQKRIVNTALIEQVKMAISKGKKTCGTARRAARSTADMTRLLTS